MSPQFWQTLGYNPSEMQHLASEWQDIIFPEDKALALENFQKHCEDPNHPYDQLVRYRHKDGSTVWVRCRGVAIRNSAGAPIRMLGAHSNVTDLKNAELKLAEKNDELIQYSYAVSHDLKAPIGNAALAMQILETRLNDSLGTTERRLISEIGASMSRMVSVIEDLHRIAVLDNSDGTVQSFTASDAIAAIQLDLGQQISETKAQITLRNDANLTANKTLFTQVLYNLISNSLKYRQESTSPHVDIDIIDSGAHWRVDVQDNGLGIDRQHHQKIFGFLQRLHLSHEIPGTGLGLSFCRKAVTQMGGQLTVHSELGRGSLFSFTVAKKPTYST